MHLQPERLVQLSGERFVNCIREFAPFERPLRVVDDDDDEIKDTLRIGISHNRQIVSGRAVIGDSHESERLTIEHNFASRMWKSRRLRRPITKYL
jgi:hypothetical protein